MTILLDASRSMKFTSHRSSKLEYAQVSGGIARLSGAPAARRGGSDRVRRRGAEFRARRRRGRGSCAAVARASNSASRARAPTSSSPFLTFRNFCAAAAWWSRFRISGSSRKRSSRPWSRCDFAAMNWCCFTCSIRRRSIPSCAHPVLLEDLETGEAHGSFAGLRGTRISPARWTRISRI